jgi:hypothetical protein
MEELETKKITKIEFVKRFSFKFVPTFRHSVNGIVLSQFFIGFPQLLGKRLRNIK